MSDGPTDIETTNLKEFLSEKNLKFIVREINRRYNRNKEITKKSLDKYLKTIEPYANNWADKNKINEDYSAASGNIYDVISFINRKFIDQWFFDVARVEKITNTGKDPLGCMPSLGDKNVMKEVVMVDGKKKHPRDLMAEDYGQIDFWAPYTIEVSNKVFREGNQIPLRQKMLHNRRYETDLETLHDRNGIQEKDVLIFRKYDMSQLDDPIYDSQNDLYPAFPTGRYLKD
jgi:hypothetical protein